MTLSEKALEVAIGEDGKQEIPKGSNWGEHVQKYLASVGITFPASWCCAFVYWSFEQAAIQMGVKNPLFKTGGVINLYNHSQANRRSTPMKGDVFIMDHGHGLGHTGMVIDVQGDYVYTIEGNTNDTGSREGFEVCKKKRIITSIKSYLRFS